MPSVDQIVAENRHLFSPVPPASADFVCACCLGPVNQGFSTCYGCSRFPQSALPESLRTACVPMTAALNPSPWYTRLITYKAGHPAYQSVLAALAYSYLTRHRAAIEARLDGPWETITIESKVGRVSLTREIERQVLKDAELLRSGKIGSAEWIFQKSPTTNKVGPTGRVIVKSCVRQHQAAILSSLIPSMNLTPLTTSARRR